MGSPRTKQTTAAAAILLGLLVGARSLAHAQRAAEPPVRSGPPSWVADAVFYEVFPERFRNGDPAYLLHAANNFGRDPEGDGVIWATENPNAPAPWKWTSADRLFLRLVQECHRRQIKVVLDGTFNHVGVTFWAFRDVRARGVSSRYAGWFAIKAFDDPKTPADEFDYHGFGALRELPELRKEGGTLAAPVRDHLRAVVRRWGDPNGDGDPSDGIDGWRLEAADRVPHGFWKEFRRTVLGINHEAYIVGEVFWEDWDFNKLWDPAPWLKGDELDAVMNYRLAAAARAFFLDRQTATAASELDARLAARAPGRK